MDYESCATYLLYWPLPACPAANLFASHSGPFWIIIYTLSSLICIANQNYLFGQKKARNQTKSCKCKCECWSSKTDWTVTFNKGWSLWFDSFWRRLCFILTSCPARQCQHDIHFYIFVSFSPALCELHSLHVRDEGDEDLSPGHHLSISLLARAVVTTKKWWLLSTTVWQLWLPRSDDYSLLLCDLPTTSCPTWLSPGPKHN